jgi:hypothetical protein
MNWPSFGPPGSPELLAWLSKTKRKVFSSGKRLVPVALCAGVALALAQAVPACSSATPANSTITNNQTTPKDATTTAPTQSSCSHPETGCPCSSAGATANCGRVIIRSGSTLQCFEGTITCDGTTWGECDGQITVNGQSITGGGVAIQGLGNPMLCGAANPCDPYCSVTTDTPPGVDAGAGLSTSDAGLQVAIPPNLNTCYEATQGSSLYSTLSSTYAGNPASCTGGASDNCNSDYACSAATMGTCQPYADGVVNASTACASQPDFTVGLGCWDTSAPTGFELEVCNRGGVEASSGSLVVAIESQAPILGAGTCPATSKVASGPALPALSTSAGTCTIPLATDPIGPGECLSFNVNHPNSSSITCTSTAGGAITIGANAFADINPPSTIDATYTPLPECDSCNNYTAVSATAQPSGSPPAGAGACTLSWCGYNAGAGGSGSSCITTISGTVMDPGLNVGLSNIEVYIPTETPITLHDEPANDGGTMPAVACDTCASLNTTFTNGVETDVHGNFNLTVQPGTYTVIAQTGRWRRIATSIVANACTNTVIPTANISMPQNRTQGNIPKMAVVGGKEESLECWLVKIGISSSEIAPYTSGMAQRIQVYESANAGGTGENFWSGTAVVTPPSASILWDNSPNNTLDDYSALLLPCDGESGGTADAAAQTAMLNYANMGGRIFMDHWGGREWVENGSAATPTITGSNWSTASVASWNDSAPMTPASPQQVTVLDTTPDQESMYNWLAAWDSTPYGAGYIQSQTPRQIATTVGSDSIQLSTFGNLPNAPAASGDAVASFWFNTPITASTGGYCGRVVYNDMHVSPTRSTNLAGGATQANTFPATCSASALTSEELALEYEFFQITACNLGTSQPIPPSPPPPPPPPLMSETFKRVFEANCTPGYTVKWGFFEWKASVPTGTSINFTAATAPENSGGTGPGTFGTAVPIGMATMSSTTMYTATMNSVDLDLTSAMPAQSSQQWLEVNMTLNPSGTISPALLQWQQLFDCVP